MVVSTGFVKGQGATFFVFSCRILQLFDFSCDFSGQINFFFRIYTGLPAPNHPAQYNLGGPTLSRGKMCDKNATLRAWVTVTFMQHYPGRSIRARISLTNQNLAAGR